MRVFIFVFMLGTVSLFAGFFPKSVTTSVASVDGETIYLKRSLGREGMSGALIHNFRDIEAMTGYLMQTGKPNEAKLVLKNVIKHDKLPSIKTPPQKGDKVIGGYLYGNVMAIAPDMTTYDNIVKAYPSKTWFHPDLLAVFLSSEGEAVPTPELLETFATEYQIGLFYIVKKDEAVLYDPISRHVVARKPFRGTVKNAKFPFFMRFDKFRTGIFSDTSEEDGNYYEVVEQFK